MLRFYDIVRRKDLKLYFPPKFVEEHARNLRDMIVLEVADGETWDVKLKKGDHDHEVWLTTGWSEFAKFYSIQPGHLLQFTYEGNSHFHVIIFGISAMEIDYPSSFHCLEVKEEYDSDASVQIVEHFPTYYPKRNKRAAPTDQILQPHKTNLTHHKGTEAGKTKTTVPPKRNLSAESTRGLKFPKQKGRHNHGLFMSSTKIGQRSEISRLQASAFERAKDFKSDYPFFTVPMQPTYARGFYMNIPVTFVEKYLGHKDIKFNIRDSNGRTWAVEYVYQITGRPKAKFKAGWKEFVRDNDVEVGDVCVFELIKMDQGVNLLQVHIFPSQST